jgi:3-phenylpropionate/trans-cinnamate dioxygenase ferredoxin reductase subunit
MGEFMSEPESIVIAGASLAGAKAAEALREQGYGGAVVLLGAEPHLPYERPELTKKYLLGKSGRDEVFLHDAAWYADRGIDLRLGLEATEIDRAGHLVALSDGSAVGYGKLLLTTGARPRTLSGPGADAHGVHYLRTIDDSESVQRLFASASRVVVVGAGWIGLEVTAAARAAGVEVTVVESARLPLLRVLGAEVAEVFVNLHREHGVDFRFGATLEAITTSDGRATGVRLADGTEIAADAVVVAVGVSPNIELAEAAGLTIDNGILVDDALRTSDPDIFAAGDVANAYHPLLDKHIRVEHWANALKQPAVAATGLLGGEASYADLPYFYTDQYDLGMEYVGYVESEGYDEVVFRGDVDGREFIAFWLTEGRVLAGMNVNVWDVVDPIKELVRSRKVVDREQLRRPDHPLEEL